MTANIVTITVHFTDGSIKVYKNQTKDLMKEFMAGKTPFLFINDDPSKGDESNRVRAIPLHSIKSLAITV